MVLLVSPHCAAAARGSLTLEKRVFNNPDHALEGLEQFSHVWCVVIMVLSLVTCNLYSCVFVVVVFLLIIITYI